MASAASLHLTLQFIHSGLAEHISDVVPGKPEPAATAKLRSLAKGLTFSRLQLKPY